ncbi:DUF4885 family protein [Viridibacillus sp. YIM B01967]|uniref:DUF4885 family protein n=1 Tax=Viridibacillus soli TaxID=2798301 RepID=A0ABS1H903_9BACL|nr:DUF4885 family protein [Viridibacillus soli]MBK3495896.1 DUF4885 family protein [Viridibacillus soli]
MKINNGITPYAVTTASKQTILNKTTIENKDDTIIQRNNIRESESDKRRKILDDKYQKINEQNKQFKNPHIHIQDKYHNPYSPYFRSDLTEAERNAASSMESSMLRKGVINCYDYADAAFREKPLVNDHIESAKKKLFNRQQVNGQLHELFAKNGITLPQGSNLTFTIHPSNFKLTVSGTNDSSLIDKLEGILNTANNTRELFFHIMQSRSDDSSQFTRSTIDKFRLVNEIKTMTGYDLKDLDIVNGQFVTEDGTDIFEIYKEKLRQNPYTKAHVGVAASYYGSQIYQLAKNGFNSIPDLVLSIGYENGSLQDIGQKENYGTGKNDWINNF